ncbi:MAG: putative sulfate/molybdate transporter, partial [Candidatus Ranarchaeia archaeon]
MSEPINRKPFVFSLSELSGAFGDLGLLIPFSISLVLISGVNPVGLLFGIGITNILLGLIYTYPIALQPMKAIGTTAITEKFSAAQVGGAGFGCGIFWLIASLFIDIDKYAKKIPKSVSYGISVGLALILGYTALQFMGLSITPLTLDAPILLLSFFLFSLLVIM